MTLVEDGYRPRVADQSIGESLQAFGAVSVEGPKYCGKTWTSLNHADSVFYIADPAGGFANRQRAELDPSLILDGAAPRLIDEWQDVPGIWDAVRFAVDRSHKKGRFILAGSSMPPLEGRIHSGAGRIDLVRMWTMTAFEQGFSNGSVSLAGLLAGQPPEPSDSSTTLDGLVERVVRGGWPEGIGLPLRLASRIPASYLSRVTAEDMSRIDGVFRDTGKVKSTIASLARNNSQAVKISTILQDIDAGAQTVSRDSVVEYLSALRRLYILEEIPSWSPNYCSRKRLRLTPKRLLTDQSLAVAALGLTVEKLRADLLTLGFMFEAMCLKDLLVYCAANNATVFHYADDTNLDADAIIEMADGSRAAVEIKLGHHQVDEAAAKLLKLQGKLVKAGIQPPACLLVIAGISSFAHQRPDGVIEVPLDCLGP